MSAVITPEDLRTARLTYEQEGWYKSPRSLGPDQVERVRASIERISGEIRPEVVYEEGSRVVRAIHGCHDFDPVCAGLVRLPFLVDLAEALLGEQAYVYQFKVNLKQPYEGAAWPWHQDYAFWSKEDGMPTDRALTIAIFLDDAHEENGPLNLLPETHRLGVIPGPVAAPSGGPGEDWEQHVSAKLTYTVPDDVAQGLRRGYGLHKATGPAGTVYAFHPSIVHSSADNRSPDRRALLLISYNAVSNAPGSLTRPPFLVSRDSTPVTRLDSDLL